MGSLILTLSAIILLTVCVTLIAQFAKMVREHRPGVQKITGRDFHEQGDEYERY